MSISSIDDLLMGVGNSQQPITPEHKEAQEKVEAEEIEQEEKPTDNYSEENPIDDTNSDESASEPDDKNEEKPEKSESDNESDSDSEVDEYGNEKERLPKGMRDRLDRKEKQHQREIEQREHELQVLRQQLAQTGASKEVQQATKDFKYDENDGASWQQQLTDFVKQTVKSMANDDQQVERQRQEVNAQREFQQKFTKGMDRFGDFKEIVGAQPIDDAMTLSLRGMSDPTAFIYAASKRHPQELERISKLSDPYTRMVEMGKLEERMRRNKPTTKTPRPLGRTKEDATTRVTPKEKETTGDDLLAKADAKRLSLVKTRHKANR